MFSNEYVKERFNELSKAERKCIGSAYKDRGILREKWTQEDYENTEFHIKYCTEKYDRPSLKDKRNDAYRKRFGAGKGFIVARNVHFSRSHYAHGKITIGANVNIQKNSEIDYSGGLVIGNSVSIAEETIILTHNHDYMQIKINKVNEGYGNAFMTPLVIEDDVWIGARCFINSGVGLIGRKAILAAGTVIKKKVLPYAIVMGNPAKIVGFTMRPDEAFEYECLHYPEAQRIPLSVLEKNYQKYFVDRIDDIKKFTTI